MYASAVAEKVDPKLLVKLSAELRLLDKQVAALLKDIETDAPAKESLTSIKARRAVNVRWDNERARNAAN